MEGEVGQKKWMQKYSLISYKKNGEYFHVFFNAVENKRRVTSSFSTMHSCIF